MSNSWVRLWLDLPTDPKFRTIAKVSKQPLSAVIAVFICMLTDAANADERGRTQMNDEDLASTLDLEIEQIRVIREAMQGRVLEDGILTGWHRRQPMREDGSAERSKAWRESRNRERNRTQPNAKKRPDTDTDTDKKEKEKSKKKKVDDDGDEGFVQFWTAYPHKVGKVEALQAFGKLKPDGKMLREILAGLERYKANKPAWQGWKNPGPWLNQRRWEDMPHAVQSAASQHQQPDWLQGVV